MHLSKEKLQNLLIKSNIRHPIHQKRQDDSEIRHFLNSKLPIKYTLKKHNLCRTELTNLKMAEPML